MPMYCEGDDDDLPVITVAPSKPTKQEIVTVPILLPPVLEVSVQPESKTVAFPDTLAEKQDIPVEAPIHHRFPERPAIAYLDKPNVGDGTNDGAVFRGGYVGASESNPAVWHAHGRAQQDQIRHIQPGLR